MLNGELDVEDGMMCVFVDDTEISHLLRAHMNDQENLEVWQADACTKGAETIDKLRAEVKRLRFVIKYHANYAYEEADTFRMRDWHKKANEKRMLGDSLIKSINNI